MQKTLKNYWNPGTWVLVWEHSARAIQWIPTWQGLGGFQISLRPCALGESSLSIGRVKKEPEPLRECLIGPMNTGVQGRVLLCASCTRRVKKSLSHCGSVDGSRCVWQSISHRHVEAAPLTNENNRARKEGEKGTCQRRAGAIIIQGINFLVKDCKSGRFQKISSMENCASSMIIGWILRLVLNVWFLSLIGETAVVNPFISKEPKQGLSILAVSSFTKVYFWERFQEIVIRTWPRSPLPIMSEIFLMIALRLTSQGRTMQVDSIHNKSPTIANSVYLQGL